MTLIHLVSEQTLQNLLPTLALRPKAILQIRSADRRFAGTPRHLEEACRKAELPKLKFLPIETVPSESPSIEETETLLNNIRARHADASWGLNLTGGTKLMSIGAYRFAEYQRLPSLYTDTQNRRAFVDASTGTWDSSLPNLMETVKKLTVPMVMAAQGKDFRDQMISPELLHFGARAWELRMRHPAPISQWTAAIRDSVPRKNHRVIRSPSDLQNFLARPLPVAETPAASDYLDAGVEAGLLRVDLSGRAFLNAEPKKPSIERVCNLLDGGWLELAVAYFAQTGARFGDVHWSVEPMASGEPADFGETDLVMLDREALRLSIVSCKSTMRDVSTLEHLASWRDRARSLGGSHAATHVCVSRVDNQDQSGSLHRLGDAMGIRIHIGQEIPAFFLA